MAPKPLLALYPLNFDGYSYEIYITAGSIGHNYFGPCSILHCYESHNSSEAHPRSKASVESFHTHIGRIRDNIVNSHVLTCIYRPKPLEYKHDVDETLFNKVVRPRISSYNVEGSKLNMMAPNALTWTKLESKCPQSLEPYIESSLGWSLGDC
ncbi:unnamed protein product [Cylicocyclus nassatus]|uniref:Uncharacterized protein n=1 Tax=Cylicocyclus nassatus TaxID=53992 RepID=A0AA36MAI5_CYLNA|nr:unnamed protein product [Cylicocyclus nassatus]